MTSNPAITVITPNWNGERFLERTLESIREQRNRGVALEYIVVDGGSTDRSREILAAYRDAIDVLIVEPDQGPASAINKGLRRANGDVVAWLNADDVYAPDALTRVVAACAAFPERALGFGRCRIIDEEDREIRRGITRFKEAFFPFSSRFTIQCINYISQPAMFFRREAMLRVGGLREDLKAAWDYEYILRLWRCGGGFVIPGPPLADFRWH
ncbi:MAG TPA: glycosyltransferase family 2 protein, partial [Kiritimatiellia bacterium]|nr:glycosyltransferase family 2 protein [Kiritimatiellia bacterium]